ncbi:MAG: energy-coupling factor transporter transmembrane protein EcfT [Candidatus Heimdallarchaeota archaeon]|nr:energy-coupling factor transporter transmembrane protein EcfT [Candidatus Heimdallarchaeota archaeon]
MSESSFLLPFREKPIESQISPIAISILVVISLVFLLVSKVLLDVVFVYVISLIFLLSLKARFFKTLKVVLTAGLIIFFLGLSSLFLKQGPIIFQVPIGSWTISFYEFAVQRAIFIWVRGIFSVSIITLYTTVITVQEFIQSLRSLFLPNILVTLILLILRYTPMLYQQGSEVKISQELRGLATAPFKRRFSAATSRIGGTLIRSMRKGSEVYEGMVLRGLENSEIIRRSKTKWLDWLILPLIVGVISLVAGGVLSGLINSI